MKTDRDKFQQIVQHALSYTGHFIMQVVVNSWKMFVTQTIFFPIMTLIVTVIVYIKFGLIKAEFSSDNIIAALSIIGITLLLLFAVNFIRAPFQLDREREETIKKLEQREPLLISEIEASKLKLVSGKDSELKPNIVYLETYTSNVITDSVNKQIWKEEILGFEGYLIKFENELIEGKEVAELKGVTATIFIKGFEGKRLMYKQPK